jgi:hypothetical protein
MTALRSEFLLLVTLAGTAATSAFGQLKPAVELANPGSNQVLDQFPIYRVRGVTISCCLNRRLRDQVQSSPIAAGKPVEITRVRITDARRRR